MCDVTRSYLQWLVHMCHDSFTCDVTHTRYDSWMCDMPSGDIHVWRDLFICAMTHSHVTWRIDTRYDSWICDMAHAYVTWPIYVWRDSFIWDVTHSYGKSHTHLLWLDHIWRDSCIFGMTHSYGTWLIHMSHLVSMGTRQRIATHCNTLQHTATHVTHSSVTLCVHAQTSRVDYGRDSFMWDMTHSYGTLLIHLSHLVSMTHSCETWLIICHTLCPWADTPYASVPARVTVDPSSTCTSLRVWRDSFMCDMSHSCGMTDSYAVWLIHVWHDSDVGSHVEWPLICLVIALVCSHDMTHSYVPWLMHMCHDSFTCDMTQMWVHM